jgi:hypothetical protein
MKNLVDLTAVTVSSSNFTKSQLKVFSVRVVYAWPHARTMYFYLVNMDISSELLTIAVTIWITCIYGSPTACLEIRWQTALAESPLCSQAWCMRDNRDNSKHVGTGFMYNASIIMGQMHTNTTFLPPHVIAPINNRCYSFISLHHHHHDALCLCVCL